MKNLGFGIAAIAALMGTSAWAADMAVKAPPPVAAPVPLPFNWTGWYVGVNGGPATRSSERSNVTGFNHDDPGGPTTTGVGNIDPDGGFGGGQIGYNWQIAPQWVVGIEADIQGGNISDSSTVTVPAGVPSPDTPVVASATNRLDWFGTVRVRAGYTLVDRWLSYVTGGFAFGGVRDSLGVSEVSEGALLTGSVNSNTTKTGWIVGYGSEVYITPQFSLRAESDYMSLGSTTLATGTNCDPDNCANDIPSATANLNHKYWLFRVGLNYKWY